MSDTRHRNALWAFEENDQFEEIQSKLTEFLGTQKKQAKFNADHFDWIHDERKLKNAVTAMTKQILQGISNVLADAHKERDFMEVSRLCGIDPGNTTKAIQSLQDDMSLLQSSPCIIYQGQDMKRIK